MDVSRRDFLKQAGVLGAGTVASVGGATQALASGDASAAADSVGVLVDLTKCNGCRRCEAACAQANGFPVPADAELKDTAVFAEHRRPGPQSYTTVNSFPSAGDPANGGGTVFVKTNCLHCVDPACVSACLVRALQKDPRGPVTYDPWKCMGCRYCMVACPFQIPAYEYDKALTPQVRKCTLCMNEGNPHRGGVPACVQACPMECLTYGRRSDLLAQAHEKIKAHPEKYIDHVYGEHEAGGTSWMYVAGAPFEELGFLNISAEAPPRLTEAIQHAVFKHFVPPVAWCAILGMAMWLNRPAAGPHAPLAEAAGEPAPDPAPSPAEGARP